MARDRVPLQERVEWWRLVATARRLHVRTAGVKAAARRRIRRARQVAREQDRLTTALDDRIRDRHCREERDRVRVQRVRVQVIRRGDLDNSAEVHDGYP